MAKHAVRVAVRNVVKVVTVAPRAASRSANPPGVTPSAAGRPELLAGVSWDDSRKVWLVHPPGRGSDHG
ncbi:hypothetical protein [Niveispirillum sp. BGYR6]|uniref:hypothetical protein n=1 Tax=Niveispirillum sp. BGYR6 TaxID=2971249 RepID=UPI0022B941B1|nr:hypothetical protein [Niveispirillum sp. BGYR6]MDG5495333.1 hypothetical protein [Niveispirillum sp. BGYR6]